MRLNADTVAELDETVVITLSDPYNAQFAGDAATVSGTGTITNDDDAVVTIVGSSVDEGDGEAEEVPAELEFTVRLSGPVADTVTVQYADAGTGTATAGEDYAAIGPGTITFSPGDTRQPLRLTVHGDTTVEPHETVVLALSNPTGAVFAGGADTVAGTGTIRDDDGTPAPPPPPGSHAGGGRRGGPRGGPGGCGHPRRLGILGPRGWSADLRLEPGLGGGGDPGGRRHRGAVVHRAVAAGRTGVRADGDGSGWVHRQRRRDGDGARSRAGLRVGGGAVAGAGGGRGRWKRWCCPRRRAATVPSPTA